VQHERIGNQRKTVKQSVAIALKIPAEQRCNLDTKCTPGGEIGWRLRCLMRWKKV
jgi:hypothetical protein